VFPSDNLKKLPSSRQKHLAGTVISADDTSVPFSIQCQTQFCTRRTVLPDSSTWLLPVS